MVEVLGSVKKFEGNDKMLISISIIVLSISMFFGLYLISRAIKNQNMILNYILKEEHEEDYEDDFEVDDLFSGIDDDTMVFVFDDFDNLLNFFKLANLPVNNSIIGKHKCKYYLDLSKLPLDNENKYRIIAIESYACEVRDKKIANYIKDWIYKN